ncbi:MAG TPA: hypothetical protein VGI40_21100 [Pirellulaceae bacterium]|jgi:hypothetical protein
MNADLVKPPQPLQGEYARAELFGAADISLGSSRLQNRQTVAAALMNSAQYGQVFCKRFIDAMWAFVGSI